MSAPPYNPFLVPGHASLYGRKGGLIRKYSDAELEAVAHLSVRSAAAELGCSPSTVQTYRKNRTD